jgi:glycosyltransferase involved in cell wall biosynthesis
VRVGLVLHGLDRPISGVTRVALELAQTLAQLDDCEVVPLTTYRDGPYRGPGSQGRYLPGCERVPGLAIFGGPLTSIAARRYRLDVVHDPVGVSPFTLGSWAGAFGRILTIHDAIAFRDPRANAWANAMLHRWFVPATLANVDRIITVSEHARGDLVRLVGISPERVSVVPNGVSNRFRPVPQDEARRIARRYGIEGPYVLHVGAPQRRKNVEGLVEAFRRLGRRLPDHRLVLVGPPRGAHDPVLRLVRRLSLGTRVRFLSAVPDQDLPAIYSAASVFAFPSLYEGFGMPILEAMSCGTPVVCSNATSLPEVAGNAAVLVDPRDTAALALELERVLDDPILHASLSLRGLVHAAPYSWERAARSTLEVYQRALADRRA